MQYSSLGDIIDDPALGLAGTTPTQGAVRKAIDEKLRSLQPETTEKTSELYLRLVAARGELDELTSAMANAKGAAVVPMPVAAVERLIDAVARVAINNSEPQSSPLDRMQEARTSALARASRDFRNQRALPLAGLGTVSVTIWGTRQAFGANLSHVGTLAWAIASGAIVLVTVAVWILIYRVQTRDEETLRREFNPDIQASALRLMKDMSQFTRQDFRVALWARAYYPRLNRRQRLKLDQHKQLMASGRVDFEVTFARQSQAVLSFLSTVDLADAMDDATQLAVERFTDMGVISASQELGLELFSFTNPLQI